MAEPQPYVNFSRGIANRVARGDVPEGYVQDLRNLDPTPGGDLRLRSGASKVYTATDLRGAWEHGEDVLLVDGSSLVLFNTRTLTSTTLATVAASGPVSHARVGAVSYLNTLTEQLRIDGDQVSAWAVPNGPHMAVQVVSGYLSAGRYRVAATYTLGGVEGGVLAPVTVDLQDGEGVQLTLPTPPTDCQARIYLTDTNGKVLYRQTTTASTSVTLTRVALDTAPLATAGLVRPPRGSMMADSQGMLAVAEGATLWVSEPMMPHLFDPVRSTYQFPGGIRFLVGAEYGFVIGHERGVTLLTGAQGEAPALEYVDKTRPFQGAAMRTRAGEVWWLTERGPTQLTRQKDTTRVGGEALASDHFVMGRHDHAAVGAFTHNGMELVLVAPKDSFRPNGLVSTDYYEVDVLVPAPPSPTELLAAANDFADRVFAASALGF